MPTVISAATEFEEKSCLRFSGQIIKMRYLLLTGATGLVGRYLLKQLLERGERVAVLARPAKLQSPRDRVDVIMSRWEKLTDRSLPRPVVIEADLSESGLGLDSHSRDWIAKNCDSVFHNAASMSFREDAQGEPFRTNVDGMKHLLELCRDSDIRQFHHVSTCYICGLRTGRIFETDVDQGQELGNVYEESKLAAEKLVRNADFLESVTIYRPASVVGDSQTGYCTTLHGFYHPLQLAYTVAKYLSPEQMTERFLGRLGLDGNERKNLVPVDWLSQAIVELYRRPEHHGQTYHLASPEPVTVQLIQEVVQEAISRYAKHVARHPLGENELEPYDELFHDHMLIYRSHWRDDPEFDLSNTEQALADLPCPTMDHDRLMQIARFPIERQFNLQRYEPIDRSIDVAESIEPFVQHDSETKRDESVDQLLALQINGCGGGQWHLRIHNGRISGAELGLGPAGIPRCYFSSETFKSIMDSRISAEQAIRSGRIVAQGDADPQLDAAKLIEQIVAPNAQSCDGEQQPQSPAEMPLAIVGMACRLPGADNLDEFWQMLIEGRSAIVELPEDRLDQELYYDPEIGVRGKTYSKLASIISSRHFDRESCPIPESLAKSVDNAHLLMCETAAEALRHAGYDPFQLETKNTGVYIGHAQGSELGGDYTYGTCIEEAAQFLREVEGFERLDPEIQDEVIQSLVERVREKMPARTPESADVSANMIAGTISKAFGLTGPFAALNSACASSLQAVLIAARQLQLGRVEMAIVGGASDCKSDSLVLFSQARAMSSTGSRPFDRDADGLIVSEGYVAVVIKTLERALADGDEIQAVIRGLGASSDGIGKSLWAPRKEGQIKAMERAYRGGLDMGSLQYIEAHATATQVGDATELNTLADVLRDKLPAGRKIPITSVKANIGHALEAAGIAGLIKTVLAMQHGIVPPAANVKHLNPEIDWKNVPVYVPQEPAEWPQPENGDARRAGVNAFGIGGLNMHVLVEEFTESSAELVRDGSLADGSSPNHNGRSKDKDGAVAVIGMGCVFPGALNVSEYWELLNSGRDPKCAPPPDRWRADLAFRAESAEPYRSAGKIGGYITNFEYDWRTHMIPPIQIAQADPLQFMLLDAADQSMIDAGYNSKPFDRSRMGVVVGTEFGSDFAFQLQNGAADS